VKSATARRYTAKVYVAPITLRCLERERKAMPVYDFKCECGHTSTITIELAYVDGFIAGCICGKEMKRIIAVPAVTFKGSGWGKDKN
jgi:predicted nucleic acid-binding Zn ribbon protein